MSWYQYMAEDRPSFMIGMARILDFCQTLTKPFFKKTNSHYEPVKSDREAFYEDWKNLGYDIVIAEKQFNIASSDKK